MGNRLNLKELRKKNNSKTISSKEALKEVIKFNWNSNILENKDKIIVK